MPGRAARSSASEVGTVDGTATTTTKMSTTVAVSRCYVDYSCSDPLLCPLQMQSRCYVDYSCSVLLLCPLQMQCPVAMSTTNAMFRGCADCKCHVSLLVCYRCSVSLQCLL